MEKPERPLTSAQRRWAQQVSTLVDPRLADVWAFAWGVDARDDVPLGLLIRMAYLQGYGDALEEDDRGTLFRKLGVQVPDVKKQRRTRKPPGSTRNSGT